MGYGGSINNPRGDLKTLRFPLLGPEEGDVGPGAGTGAGPRGGGPSRVDGGGGGAGTGAVDPGPGMGRLGRLEPWCRVRALQAGSPVG